MKRQFIIILILLFTIGCTERMTKQFVGEGLEPELNRVTVDNWVIQTPTLVAYKNKRIDQIINSNYLYWLTIQANSIKNITSNNLLSIDSVGILFSETGTATWKVPTRVTPYKQSKKQTYLAFDFFKDEGIAIPDSITKIKLIFDAVLTDTVNNVSVKHSVFFNMFLQDTAKMTPFMIH